MYKDVLTMNPLELEDLIASHTDQKIDKIKDPSMRKETNGTERYIIEKDVLSNTVHNIKRRIGPKGDEFETPGEPLQAIYLGSFNGETIYTDHAFLDEFPSEFKEESVPESVREEVGEWVIERTEDISENLEYNWREEKHGSPLTGEDLTYAITAEELDAVVVTYNHDFLRGEHNHNYESTTPGAALNSLS